MIKAFKERRTWATIIIALILGPVAVMAYLRRGWLALGFTVIPFLVVSLIIANQWVLPASLGILDTFLIVIFTQYILVVILAAIIAFRSAVSPIQTWYSRWPAVLLIFLLPILVPHLWKTFAFEPFNVPSVSMAPTLTPGDHLFVNKAAYGYSRYSFPFDLSMLDDRISFTPPKRGDVVVFRKPTKPTVHFIMRAVGLPGDKVQMINGALHLNGVEVKREAIDPYEMPSCGSQAGEVLTRYRETLPDGTSYTIVDIGQMDMDSTEVFDVPADHYFVLGDNRDNSIDSRFGAVGMVHKRFLTGRVSILYASGCDAPIRFDWRRLS